MGDVIVQMRGIEKSFPGVRALDGVDFDIRRGTVTALAGENGSGKSTLLKVLCGRYRPDAGEVLVDGSPGSFSDPNQASAAGIAMVAQEVLVHDHLTVWENMVLGNQPRRFAGLVDRRAARRSAVEALDRFGIQISPEDRLGALPIRSRQLVSILKMAIREPRVLILDEPTSSLGAAEVECLYRLVGELSGSGMAVVYVTHRLREYFDLCDPVTVLRDGSVTARSTTRELDEEALVRAMVGRDVDLSPRTAPSVTGESNPRLELAGLSVRGKLEGIDLVVAPGEIVGVAGQAGAGRSTLAKALFGLCPHEGSIRLDGETVEIGGPLDAMNLGIAYVPEDRKGAGLVLTMDVADNASITRWPDLRRRGLLPRADRDAVARDVIEMTGVRGARPRTIVGNLSGGNQQKIVLGKWMVTAPKVLLLDEPTRGIDVGAKQDVYELVRSLANDGLAVLVFSSELAELLHLCDRIAVLHRGRVADIVHAGECDEESITSLAFGRSRTSPALAGAQPVAHQNHPLEET